MLTTIKCSNTKFKPGIWEPSSQMRSAVHWIKTGACLTKNPGPEIRSWVSRSVTNISTYISMSDGIQFIHFCQMVFIVNFNVDGVKSMLLLFKIYPYLAAMAKSLFPFLCKHFKSKKVSVIIIWTLFFSLLKIWHYSAKSISLNLYLKKRKVTEDSLPREKENLGTSKSSGTLPRKWASTSHPLSCRLGILGYDDPTPLPLRFILGVLGLGPLVWVPSEWLCRL